MLLLQLMVLNDKYLSAYQFPVIMREAIWFKIAAILFILMPCFCYSLDGVWSLRTAEIAELSNVRGKIFFSFNSSVAQFGDISSSFIDRVLTVSACSILSYSFNFQDDQIFMRYQGELPNVRTCGVGEINFLRSRLDSIFYFYIFGSAMLMLSIDGQPPVKLDKVISTITPNINGIWIISNGVFYSKLTDQNVTINGTHIQFCSGKTVVAYTASKQEYINISKVKIDSCNQLLAEAFLNASLFRVSDVYNTLIASFYDKNVDLIMQITLIQNYSPNQTIIFYPNITQNTISTFIPYTNPQITLPSTSITPNLTSNQINNVTSSSKNNSIGFSNSTPVAKPANAVVNNSVSNTNKNQPAPVIQPVVSNLNSWVFNPVQSVSQIYGIWYPYSTTQTPYLAAYDSKAFIVYQLIINPNRLFLSGGCNTMFSSYTFATSAFSNLNIVQTQQVCPNSYDKAISYIVFGNNTYTVSGSGPSSILAIKAKNGVVLMMFNQTPPSLN